MHPSIIPKINNIFLTSWYRCGVSVKKKTNNSSMCNYTCRNNSKKEITTIINNQTHCYNFLFWISIDISKFIFNNQKFLKIYVRRSDKIFNFKVYHWSLLKVLLKKYCCSIAQNWMANNFPMALLSLNILSSSYLIILFTCLNHSFILK